MARNNSSQVGSVAMFLFKLLALISLVILLAVIAYLGYVGYQTKVLGKYDNSTLYVNQTITNVNTTVINQGPGWLAYLLFFMLVIALGIILILILKKRTGTSIDFRKAAEDTMRILVESGYIFYWRFNGEKRRIKPADLKEIKDLGALAWVLPGSRTYFQGRVVTAGRCGFRFWRYPKAESLQQPDWEPPYSEIYCVTVNPNNILEKPDFLEPMTAKEMKKYLHDQEYGQDVSPEPIEAKDLFELRRKEGIKKVEDMVYEQTVKEAME